jgi:uncharacterized protein
MIFNIARIGRQMSKEKISQLYFASARSPLFSYATSMPAKLDKIIEKLQFDKHFDKGEMVAVKMHFGNPGTHRTIAPVFVRQVVDALKAVGAIPFVADSVRIKGHEYLHTANINGYNSMTLGCPVIMADGIFGNDSVEVEAGRILKKVPVPSVFYDVTGMVVLTHATGHAAYGFGGAMKNIAMGLASHHARGGSWTSCGRGKMHLIGRETFEYNAEKCTMCGQCEDICPLGAITMEGGLMQFDWNSCWRCLRCTRVCQSGALVQPEVTDDFYEALSEGAKAAMNTFKPGKVQHISFLLNLQPECDCMPMSDTPLVSDIGILAGEDMIAIDWATLDMVGDMVPCGGSQAEGMKNSRERDVFSQVNNREPRKYLRFAEQMGLGSTSYQISNIDE